jgi:hypothetical protein
MPSAVLGRRYFLGALGLWDRGVAGAKERFGLFYNNFLPRHVVGTGLFLACARPEKHLELYKSAFENT